jgi:GT2 family glycosyltransferase
MTSDTGVTVAVSTRNRPRELDACLHSLAAGEQPPDGVVVVDQSDGSESEAVVSRCLRDGLPITYVRDARRGLGASQNLAFSRATHGVVAVIDDDCVAHARWLRVITSTLAERRDLDGVTGRVLPMEPKGDRTFPVSSRVSEVRRELGRDALPWEVGSGNNFALRREAYTRIGGCDERLGPGSPAQGGVDMDLFYRLTRAGSRILYEPNAVVYHERQTRDDRRARRPMYGRGMGAAIALWRASGDAGAGRVLRAWIALRLRQMQMAIARGDWGDVRDEMTMLRTTFTGLRQGRSLAR